MQYIPPNMKTNMRLHHSIQHDEMECRHLGLSTFWCVDVLACRRCGLSTFWSVDVSVCRRFGLSTFRSVDVSVCRRFGCRRFGLSTFWPITPIGGHYRQVSLYMFMVCLRNLACKGLIKMHFGQPSAKYLPFCSGLQLNSPQPTGEYHRSSLMLTLYVLNFSEGTKTYTCIHILCHSSTLTWHR